MPQRSAQEWLDWRYKPQPLEVVERRIADAQQSLATIYGPAAESMRRPRNDTDHDVVLGDALAQATMLIAYIRKLRERYQPEQVAHEAALQAKKERIDAYLAEHPPFSLLADRHQVVACWQCKQALHCPQKPMGGIVAMWHRDPGAVSKQFAWGDPIGASVPPSGHTGTTHAIAWMHDRYSERVLLWVPLEVYEGVSDAGDL